VCLFNVVDTTGEEQESLEVPHTTDQSETTTISASLPDVSAQPVSVPFETESNE
jgi:hypothetical protein